VQVPFAKDSITSEIPINWYPAADTDKQDILMGTPGSKTLISLDNSGGMRGLRVAGEYLYAVCGDELFKIESNLAATSLGTITTDSGHVWMAYNGVQVAVCDGISMWVYTIASGAWAQVTDADFPGASCLTYQDGYGAFINPNTGQFYLTALYDFTSISGTDYASAEGWPDNLTSILMNYRELWLFGAETIEVWYNAGSSPFPFARIQGGLIEQGCIAAASPAKADNVVYWLSAGRQVMMGKGYQPQIISTRRMEREIDNYAVVSDAVGFTQVFEGHTFYWLTFPTQAVTWVYDAATQQWHKRTSYPNYDRHRASCYAYFAGKHIIGDFSSSDLCELKSTYYDDDGEELIAILDSPEIRNEGKRQFFGGLEVAFRQGTVDMATQPHAMLRWSNDHGQTWSNEIHANMADIGEYKNRTIFRRLGSGYNRIFQLRVSDPVCRDILAVNWI
jgi:hypothetical protein